MFSNYLSLHIFFARKTAWRALALAIAGKACKKIVDLTSRYLLIAHSDICGKFVVDLPKTIKL